MKTGFTGQQKNLIIDYFFQSIEKYKVTAEKSSTTDKLNLVVGGSNFSINTRRSGLVKERNVLSR